MSETFEQELTERFIARCRENGLKITPQRLAIYKELFNSKEHPSADMVYRKIVAEHPTISFDTVNRTLHTFADIGVIDSVESHSGVRRYDSDVLPHHHLHCVKCGTIFDFCDPRLDVIEVDEEITRHFSVLGKRVVISGICDSCSKEEPEKSQAAAG